MNKKFKFIELPRPEITLTPEGESHILGGAICDFIYIQCVTNKDDTCPDTWDVSKDCNGNPIGCEGGLYCGKHGVEVCEEHISL